MSNKYQSNVRTYMARNLLWNSQGSPVDLHVLDAPNNISLNDDDGVLQFYRSYGSAGVDWNISGNVLVKRFGLFCNFADGLVMSNISTRLVLSLRTAIFYITPVVGSTVFTRGSNIITGTNLDDAFGTGAGYKGFITDDTTVFGGNYYSVLDVAANGLSARISDYAYRDSTLATISKLAYSNLKVYETVRVPVMNVMFDTEVFFNNSIAITDTTHCPLLLAIVNIRDGTVYDFYTKTVDTSYNTLPVSFDGMIEAEITPA
jgi:hypothetical protein